MGIFDKASKNKNIGIVCESMVSVLAHLKSGRYSLDWCENISLMKINPVAIIKYGVVITGGCNISFALRGNTNMGLYSYDCPAHNLRFVDKKAFATVNRYNLGGKITLHKRGIPSIKPKDMKNYGVDYNWLLGECAKWSGDNNKSYSTLNKKQSEKIADAEKILREHNEKTNAQNKGIL